LADVLLTPKAKDDLKAIWSFLAAESESAADRMIIRFAERFDLAADFPEMGVLRPELGRNVRSLTVGQYLVLYRRSDQGVAVIRVIHGRTDPTAWIE